MKYIFVYTLHTSSGSILNSFRAHFLSQCWMWISASLKLSNSMPLYFQSQIFPILHNRNYLNYEIKQAGKNGPTLASFCVKSPQNIILWHLMPLNFSFRIFSNKLSGSKNALHCPLQSCKKLGRSLEPFWRRGQRLHRTDT